MNEDISNIPQENVNYDEDNIQTLTGLEHIRLRKRELQILWNQKLLGRNVFEEMIEGGAGKIEEKIRMHECQKSPKAP